MLLSPKDIQREIDGHKKYLNEDFEQYRDMEHNLDKNATIAEIIMSCDWEGDDFNMGFEQGYIRGMEAILSLSTKKPEKI